MIANSAQVLTNEAREVLVDMADAISLVDDEDIPRAEGEPAQPKAPKDEGVEGVDWHWVRGEKVPLKLNSYEGVSVGLARPIVRGTR